MLETVHNGSRRRRLTPVLLLALTAVTVVVGLSIYLSMSPQAPVDEGPVLPVSVSSRNLDFGVIPVNSKSMRQLILKNEGEAPLRARLSISGSSYRVNPESLVLHPHIVSRVSVYADTSQPGQMRDELRIGFDEGAPLVIGLEGTIHAGAAGGAPEAPESARPRATDIAGQGSGEGSEAIYPGDPAAGQPQSAGDSPMGGATASAAGAPTTGASPLGVAKETRQTRIGPAGNSASGQGAMGLPTLGVVVRPYDPATSTPIESMAQSKAAARPSPRISEEEARDAVPLPKPPQATEEDPRDDIFDDDDDDDRNPFTSPTLRIEGASRLSLVGKNAYFYPQELGVLGSDAGGNLGLTAALQFPVVALAFGESMAISQTGPATGQLDGASGTVQMQIPIKVVDSDGHAAPMVLQMTTAMAVARNESGIAVSAVGKPWDRASGTVHLVGMQQIPVGFSNSAEQFLVVVDLYGALSFGTSISNPSSSGFGQN